MLLRNKSPLSTDGQGPLKSGLEKQPTAHSPHTAGAGIHPPEGRRHVYATSPGHGPRGGRGAPAPSLLKDWGETRTGKWAPSPVNTLEPASLTPYSSRVAPKPQHPHPQCWCGRRARREGAGGAEVGLVSSVPSVASEPVVASFSRGTVATPSSGWRGASQAGRCTQGPGDGAKKQMLTSGPGPGVTAPAREEDAAPVLRLLPWTDLAN